MNGEWSAMDKQNDILTQYSLKVTYLNLAFIIQHYKREKQSFWNFGNYLF